jgi:hypothetical protein
MKFDKINNINQFSLDKYNDKQKEVINSDEKRNLILA